MSSGDGNKVSCSITEGNSELDPEKPNLESKEDPPSKLPLDGSGDHLPLSNTIVIPPIDQLQISTKILPEEVTASSNSCMVVENENSGKDIVEFNKLESDPVGKSTSESKDITEPPVATIITPEQTTSTEEIHIPSTKPTFLENITSLASEEVDSENQDEELILKWDDDDEEDNLLGKDDEIDKDTDNVKICPDPGENLINTNTGTDDDLNEIANISDEVVSTADEINKITSETVEVTKIADEVNTADKTNEENAFTADATDNITDATARGQGCLADIIGSAAEKVISADNVTDEVPNPTGNVANKTNIVIDETDATNVTNNTAVQSDNVIDESVSSVHQADNVVDVAVNIADDVAKNTNEIAHFVQEKVCSVSETNNVGNTANSDESKNIAEESMAVDDLPSKDVESITEIKSSEDDVPEDEQEDLLSEIDAQIAQLGASISKAENEEFKNIEKIKEISVTCSEIIKPEASISQEVIEIDMTEETTEQISNQTNVLSLELASEHKKENPVVIDEILQNIPESDNKQTKVEIEGCISHKSTDEVNPDRIEQNKTTTTAATDTIVTPMEIETGTCQTKDNTIEIPEEEIEKAPAYLKATGLEFDHNLDEALPKDTEMQANSTRIDCDDIEMTETFSKDASFAHDSSNSIEDNQHGVNKPNVMLEIPTQELIDLDESMISTQDTKSHLDETGSICVDLTDGNLESMSPNKESILENKTVGTEGLDNNVLVQQDSELSNKHIPDEANLKNDTVTKPDCPAQDTDKNKVITEKNIATDVVANPDQNESKDPAKLDDNSGSKTPLEPSASLEVNTTKVDVLKAADDISTTTSIVDEIIPIADQIQPTEASTSMDVQPATQMELQPNIDAFDDAAEVTDSLGLLAESSRVREEDDADVDADADDQETSEHDDDDEDYDPDDESSNQQTAEHSEEDSAQQLETDVVKTHPETETEVGDSTTKTDIAFELLKQMDQDTVPAESVDKVISETADKDAEFEISNVVTEDTKEAEGELDIDDEIVCEEVEIPSDNIEVEENEPDVDMGALKEPADDTTKEQPKEVPKEIPVKVYAAKKRDPSEPKAKTDDVTKSPSKKKLEIAKPKHVVNIVDLESSSEDEAAPKPTSAVTTEVTSVSISAAIDVVCSFDNGNTCSISSDQGETIITLPKRASATHTPTSRLNTSEITIKTATQTEPTLFIPETTMGASKDTPASKFGGLEVFTVDSDDEETAAPPPPASPLPSPPRSSKCATPGCAVAPSCSHYDVRRKRRAALCEQCVGLHYTRAANLVEGIKSGVSLLDLEEPPRSQELVEISDSDDDDDPGSKHKETIDEQTAGMLERDLADMINATWEKFKMDAKLKQAQDELTLDLERLEKESAEVCAMLDSCQVATDKLRGELYATFAVRRHSLPPYTIFDTPDRYFMCPEVAPVMKVTEEKSKKRRLSSASESQAKKSATTGTLADHREDDNKQDPKPESTPAAVDNSKMDDDKDISVVTLSAEAAPADLPPPGDVPRPPLRAGDTVYAMRSAFGSWIRAQVLEVTPKGTTPTTQNFSYCRIKYENKTSRNAYKILPARCLAYSEPSSVRMTIGTRVVAVFKDNSPDNKNSKRDSLSSGIVAEVPNPVNKYRYLVFFDDGYAQYVQHKDTRLVCECSALVWEEVHAFSREFVRQYLLDYPERPMVRLHTGQNLKTEWNGKWWLSRVLEVDASLVHVYFEQDKRTEWIYRGSTRLAPLYLELQAAEKHRNRLPRNRQSRLNMPYVEYTRLDEQENATPAEAQIKAQQEEIRRQRAVAKKSTTPNNLPPQQPAGNLDAVTSRVVYYTPKNAVKPNKMVTHTCGPKCKRTDVLALKDLRTYNPLAKPLLSGWERQIVRYKGHRSVMYRAPCGRRLRCLRELHDYLRAVGSDMGVDLFDFGPNTHCLAEFVLNKCIVGKKDLSHGKENVPVPCVNYYDSSLPEFCSYNTERTPTAGVPLNLDPAFLCGCDCTDDCQDKSKCACWQMTLEGARTIGMDETQVGYQYKRLPDPLPSGIYECNVRCKCKATCLNRVAQHPLQLKLQVFKTLNRGWGIRALNDVPKGSFLCIYAGNLLTDATANLDGLNEGDEYLAELDYIEVVEQMKEGYEDDIPEHDKNLDKKESKKDESSSEESESEEEQAHSKSDDEDGDFEPGFIPGTITGFNKRLRKRDKKKQKEKENNAQGQGEGREGDDCITISDDEELREPSRFAAQVGMGGEFISKYRSVRTLFGKDEACYIMDAKVQGNIGRYLNHSCSPNVFVQNVFVDTHDPRFPWVAFFALTHIRAGTELTWNYNYDVGSVPGKALYCYCGAPNCRGRLL